MNNEHEYKGYKIKIVQDGDAQSPDDWGDEECFLVYNHKDFTIKRNGYDPKNIYQYLEDCHEQIDNGMYDDYYIFQVEAYIHSGVNLSLFNGTKTCNWDSSINGYVLIKKSVYENWSHKDFDKNDHEGKAKFIAEGLIETWNQYLYGDVYGYIIEKADIYYEISKQDLEEISNVPHGYINLQEFYNKADEDHNWNDIASCWGFYGDPDGYILEEAKLIIDSYGKEI